MSDLTFNGPKRTYPFANLTLATENQMMDRTKQMAKQISEDYAKVDISRYNAPAKSGALVLICVLKGSYMFTADLARALSDEGIPTQVEFICASSYGQGTSTSGQVRILLDVRDSIEGKHCIIVEDIVDSATTLNYLTQIYEARRPASLKTIVMLDKPTRRKVAFVPDYIGFEIPDKFVIGYGMDFGEDYRELRDVVVLNPEVYETKPEETQDAPPVPVFSHL